MFWSPEGDAEAALRAWVGAGLPKLEARRIEVVVPVDEPEEGVSLWQLQSVDACAMPLTIGLSLLSRVEGGNGRSHRSASPSDAIAAWSYAAKFALELVAAGRFLPTIDGGDEGEPCAATWAVVLAQDEDRERFRLLSRAMPACAHAWPHEGEDEAEEEDDDGDDWDDEDYDADYDDDDDDDEVEVDDDDDEEEDAGGRNSARSNGKARTNGAVEDEEAVDEGPKFAPAAAVLREFLDSCADTLMRQAMARVRAVGAPADAPDWAQRWLGALVGGDPSFEPQGLPERHLPDELWSWSHAALGAGAQPVRVLFELNRPADEAPETEPWRLEYELQSTDDLAQVLPLASVWTLGSENARMFQRTVRNPHDTILRALGEAARTFAPIERSLGRPRPTHVNLRPGAAWQFLSSSAPLLGLMGHGVRIPREFDRGGERRLHAQLEVSGEVQRDADNGHAIAWDAPAGFRCNIVLDGEILSGRQFQSLVRSKGALKRWKGRWVCIDPRDLATLTRVIHGIPEGRGSIAEALTFALRGTAPVAPNAPEVPVVAVDELKELVDALHERAQPMEEPKGFVGELRGYQKVGLGWLVHMQQQGVGAVLADEMGLGKTPMTLALLQRLRETDPDEWRPTLLVCPTSVLGNWGREAEKFVPKLPVRRHHGPDRARSLDEFEENCPAGALVMTTYSTARLDAELLGEMEWAGIVIDEAQNIKNPSAAQTQALRGLHAKRKLALTGTPVENRLADLWSILDWGNRGLLGPLAEFRRVVARPIERYRDPRAAKRLRRLVEPFVLRRLKTDPNVAPDLPDKVEATVACSLSAQQVKLYRKTVADTWKDIQGKSGMQRRGKVLALLTALKQVCNHPAHYLKKGTVSAADSGKLARLTEMLEEAVGQGDRALVFTQYVEMGKLLVAHLESAFGWEVPFLHGGLNARARDDMVERFQEAADAPPVFILSLKAGGTGLNLTRATHVFHYDQWWNPAVEAQATDRAHRIGQTETVYVHKLVALGTLEEKIAHMLDEKRGLAEIAYGDGEQWLSELRDDELRALVELSSDAVEDDGEGDDE